MQQFLKLIGVYNDSDKLKLKPTRLDERDARLAGDVSDAMALQRSNYVVIDPSKQVEDEHSGRVMTPQHLLRMIESHSAKIRYCRVSQVNRRRHKLEIWKLKYLA